MEPKQQQKLNELMVLFGNMGKMTSYCTLYSGDTTVIQFEVVLEIMGMGKQVDKLILILPDGTTL